MRLEAIIRTLLVNRNLWLVAMAGLAGLYALFAIDLFQEETATVADRRLRLELDEFLLFGSALILTMFGFGLNQHRARVREQGRRIVAEHNVLHLGYRDALTGIANRRAFDETLAAMLSEPMRAGSSHGIFMLDLNGFKQVNDCYGHATGDSLLIAVARQIAGTVREGDCAARLGGDEFAVLAPQLQDERTAIAIAARIASALAVPVEIDGRLHQITTGIGIALVNQPGVSSAEAARRADVALYAAKAEHGVSWRIYEG